MAYIPRVTTVPQGGTGATTLTNHGVVIGDIYDEASNTFTRPIEQE